MSQQQVINKEKEQKHEVHSVDDLNPPKSQLMNTGQQYQEQMVSKEQRQRMFEVEKDRQYFTIKFDEGSFSCVKGKCQNMISEKQFDDRSYDEFQKHPFQPIAKYIRNKSYDNPSDVRTPQALEKSLHYLKTFFFLSMLHDTKKIKKIITQNYTHKNTQNQNQIKIAQKRLAKILTVVEKQSKLHLVQEDSTLNLSNQNQRDKINPQLQTSLDDKKGESRFNYLILPEKIIVFLQSRLAAIRCQLFAQGLIFPRLTLQLLKCEIFLYTLRQTQQSNIAEDLTSHKQLKLVGLDIILDENLKQVLKSRQDFLQYYKEALTIAIFRTKKTDLMKLLQNHQLILQDQELLSHLKLRMDIQRGNYQKYFTALSTSPSNFIICLLLTHLEKMRFKLCDVLKSAKIDVKKGWLSVLLGLKINKQQSDEIINLYKNKEYLAEKYEKGESQSRQKQLKNWMKLEDLFHELILKQQFEQHTNQTKSFIVL